MFLKNLESKVIIKDKLVEHFLESLSPKTRVAYLNDLNSLSQYLALLSINALAQYFISQEHGTANLVAISWRSHLKQSGMAVSSINRRLASLRSLIAFAKTIGLISWGLEVKNFKSEPYRDVRGPGQIAYLRMLQYLVQMGTRQAIRDKAMLVLFHDLGLRRAELASLNYEDLKLGEEVMVAVSGKGKHEKELLHIPSETMKSLNEWLKIRGETTGPLFFSFDRAKKGSGRLSSNGIYERIKKIGKKVGVVTHPHALRHLAITEACKLAQKNGFGLEEVLDFSRHKSVSTLIIYRDRERNIQGKLSEMLADVRL